jgi:hypothetical protein
MHHARLISPRGSRGRHTKSDLVPRGPAGTLKKANKTSTPESESTCRAAPQRPTNGPILFTYFFYPQFQFFLSVISFIYVSRGRIDMSALTGVTVVGSATSATVALMIHRWPRRDNCPTGGAIEAAAPDRCPPAPLQAAPPMHRKKLGKWSFWQRASYLSRFGSVPTLHPSVSLWPPRRLPRPLNIFRGRLEVSSVRKGGRQTSLYI